MIRELRDAGVAFPTRYGRPINVAAESMTSRVIRDKASPWFRRVTCSVRRVPRKDCPQRALPSCGAVLTRLAPLAHLHLGGAQNPNTANTLEVQNEDVEKPLECLEGSNADAPQ